MTLKGFAWASVEYAHRFGSRLSNRVSWKPRIPGPIPVIGADIIRCPRDPVFAFLPFLPATCRPQRVMISLPNKETGNGPTDKDEKKPRHLNEFPHLKVGVARTNYSPPNGTEVILYL